MPPAIGALAGMQVDGGRVDGRVKDGVIEADASGEVGTTR